MKRALASFLVVSACASPALSSHLQPVPIDDVDGDGRAELVVATNVVGRQLLCVSSRADRALWIFQPRENYAQSAPLVALCADRDGDGARDLATAWTSRAEADTPEHVFVAVHSSRTGRVLVCSRVPTDASKSASSLLEAGDLDGDSRPELLLGVPGLEDDTGVVFALSGADLTAREFARGEHSYGQYGRAISAVGDVDGDGTGDFAIGEPGPGFDSTSSPRVEDWPSGRLANGSILIVSGRSGSYLRGIHGTDYGRSSRGSMAWEIGGTFATARNSEPGAPCDLWILVPDAESPRASALLVSSRTSEVLARVAVEDDAWDMHDLTLGSAGDWDGDGSGDVLMWNSMWLRFSRHRCDHQVGRVRVAGSRGLLAAWEGELERDSLGLTAATCADQDGDGRTDAWIARRGDGNDVVVCLYSSGTRRVLRRVDPAKLTLEVLSR